MTEQMRREAARQFFYKWRGRGNEDEDARSYWIEIFSGVLGAENATDRLQFEKKVVGADGNTKRIDVYIPETRVLIEQKSLGIPLDKPQAGHKGKTPYEQAKEYDNYLPFVEKARWIVTSNFAEIWIYDMNARKPEATVIKLALADLQTKHHVLDFIVAQEVKRITEELEISLKAGELVGELYDAFSRQYKDPGSPETLKSLNKLCVRLVFCLYGEDADVFGKKNIFHDYMAQFPPAKARKALRDLFRVLNQKPEERDPYLADDDPILASFPYVNGGLFADDDIEIPPFTQEIMDLLLQKASEDFDWSGINGTIFGAVFESTLNPETRRSGGMHYTSIENIHKVIDPLFLDDLRAEFDAIRQIEVWKTKRARLEAFQAKLASLRFLDPAAGSGNFLTETYTSLRKLENEVILLLTRGQITFGEAMNPVKVSIGQFAGIEINDFAVTVARTALWIAENQMLKATEDIVKTSLDFLPLKTSARIVEGNALKLDWSDVVANEDLHYIIGNPPFVGAQYMDKAQKADLMALFPDNKRAGVLDYVCGWYAKAAAFTGHTAIRTAFVSTNSITQGEQVPVLWKPLFESGIHIDFAYRTFVWSSEASEKANVHCVIVGFSRAASSKACKLYADGQARVVRSISPYLIESAPVFIESRKRPICDVPVITKGCQPTDGGNLIIEDNELRDFLKAEPLAKPYIKRLVGAREFINNKDRWCLWLVGITPSELRKMPRVMERVEKVKAMRLASTDRGTQKLAETPWLFRETYNPKTFIIVPSATSERRRYIPLGFLDENTISTNLNLIIPGASLYHFGVLTSNVHMAWTRTVCGRLKSDYRYSKEIVYNNFPWPEVTEAQKTDIEKTAQAILDARALYPDASLADLYDPLTMPPELLKAHQRNDAAVMRAYGMPIKETDEAACVAWLMRLYQQKARGE